MQVVFVIVEFKISNFCAVIQFNRIITNHTVSQYLASFLLGNLFLVAIYLYVYHINHKPSVPQMGATKRNNFAQRPTVY